MVSRAIRHLHRKDTCGEPSVGTPDVVGTARGGGVEDCAVAILNTTLDDRRELGRRRTWHGCRRSHRRRPGCQTEPGKGKPEERRDGGRGEWVLHRDQPSNRLPRPSIKIGAALKGLNPCPEQRCVSKPEAVCSQSIKCHQSCRHTGKRPPHTRIGTIWPRLVTYCSRFSTKAHGNPWHAKGAQSFRFPPATHGF